MVTIIGKEFLDLVVVHFSNGTKQLMDKNGFVYHRIIPSSLSLSSSLSSSLSLSSLSSSSLSSSSSSYLNDRNNNNNNNNFPIGWNGKWLWAESESEEVIHPLPSDKVLLYSLISAFLILFAGLTSGLNLSLLSIAPLKIKIMEMSSKPYDRKVVKRIKPIVRNQHFLLVTLLVANAAAMESLPIFLDRMVSSWLAITISSTLVLLFGEILPQALLASDPLKAGYYFSWVVRLLQCLTFPITYPLSLLLGKIVKHNHTTLFTPEEMISLFGIISQDKETRDQFHKDELLFLEGALKLRTLAVEREMVRWKHVKSFPYNLELNDTGLTKIWECGFSRVPVYKEHEMDIVGICLVKDLILSDPNPKPLLGHYVRRKPVVMAPDTGMIQALNLFQEKRTHFALITKDVDIVNECWASRKTIPTSVKFVGIITLEDIMEQLIQEEIEDEYDSDSDIKNPELEIQKENNSPQLQSKSSLSPRLRRAAFRGKKIERKLSNLSLSHKDQYSSKGDVIMNTKVESEQRSETEHNPLLPQS